MRTTPLYEKRIVMLQQAIIFTENNAALIADTLVDYTTPEALLDDYGYMLLPGTTNVLVRSVFEDGTAVVSHVVRKSMFFANAYPAELLNDKTFVRVVQR
jgi:hypothetical protein